MNRNNNCDVNHSITVSGCGCDSTCHVCGCNPCCCQKGCELVPCQPLPNPPTITIENLLKLIESKCDKETCKKLQYEIDLLYALLLIPKPPIPPGNIPVHPPGTIPPVPSQPLPPGGGTNPPKPGTLAFQLISNMVDSLKGDLKDKYPSAELLKAQLESLWKCMWSKQQHHGDWDQNFTYRDVSKIDDKCALDGGKDPAPGKIKVITPVDVGSTVFAMVDGKRCLFESLVNNNVTPPTKLSVLDGKWINYCDIKDVIDCVLPRTKITDCHQQCDDPNHDGVHEDKTLCEQVKECCDKEDHVVSGVINKDGSIDLTMKLGGDVHIDPKDDAAKFIEDNTGVYIQFLDYPISKKQIKDSNPGFTGTYPDDDTGWTKDSALAAGITKVDPTDDTRTEWFCLTAMNNDPINNALAKIDGSFYSGEIGYGERPVAYAKDVSHTNIEVVALRSYTQSTAQYPYVPGATNPYANVDEYVKARVSTIKANNWDTNTGTTIVALPKFDEWNKANRDHYIKTVYFDPNPWMNKLSWNPLMLYCRFVNTSAVSSTAPGDNVDSPSYTPGKMTPQPIATFGIASISNVTGIYKYRKTLKPILPKP